MLLAHLIVFDSQIGRVGHDRVTHGKREQTDRQIEVKDPAPAVVIGNVAAESWPDHRREQRRNAEDSHGCALLFPREGIE